MHPKAQKSGQSRCGGTSTEQRASEGSKRVPRSEGTHELVRPALLGGARQQVSRSAFGRLDKEIMLFCAKTKSFGYRSQFP